MITHQEEGLAGVIVGSTGLSTVENLNSGLFYRGFSITDLAEYSNFEEILYLLLYSKLPTTSELKKYRNQLIKLRECPKELIVLLEKIPKTTHPMNMLRTACSYLGNIESEITFKDQINVANRLVALMPFIISYWYKFHFEHTKLKEDYEIDNTAGYFLSLLKSDNFHEDELRAVDVSLILYAEHEFNASTFAARVTASTLSDFYSAIVSAIGTLSGPLHGGANEKALNLLMTFENPELAQKGIKAKLEKKEKIMGFGHRVYKKGDPRSTIMKKWSEKLAMLKDQQRFYDIATNIEKTVYESKKLYPNVDFYSACVYYFCAIPKILFTPIFAMSRIGGWSSHIIEQRENNRIIRPAAEYIGPAQQKYIPISTR